MSTKKAALSLIVVSLFFFAFASVQTLASTDDLILSGNGTSAISQTIIDSQNNSDVFQGGDIVINNNINANANTGGNKSSLNSDGNNIIKTGNATVNVNMTNRLNNNSATINNCCPQPPQAAAPAPSQPPKPSPTPAPSQSPSPSPTAGGIGGGNVGNPGVLGLSPTDGPRSEQYIFYILGSLCLSLGSAQLLRAKNLVK